MKMQVRYVVANDEVVYFDIENEFVRRQVLNAIPRTHPHSVDGRRGIVVPARYAGQVQDYISQLDPLLFYTEPVKAALPRLDNITLEVEQMFDRIPSVEPESRPYEPGFRHLSFGEQNVS